MPIEIKSNMDSHKGTLLHKVIRSQEINDPRVDILDEDQFIQCAALNVKGGTKYRPHKHIWKSRTASEVITQESWVVIRGSVRAVFYDIDGVFLESHVLLPGDASFTLQGGHTYDILEDDTLVYEYKTGPYEGQERDKEFL